MTGDPRADVALLDELEAARAAATPGGPWRVGLRAGTGTGYYTADGFPLGSAGLHADAALIVVAVNALPALLAAVRAGLALADEMERRVAPRSFHPAGTHTDGRSQAFAEAAAELRHALTAPLGHGDTEEEVGRG